LPSLWRSIAALTPRALTDNLEAERSRWFLWLPVALGGGVAGYFGLPAEPGLVLALALPAMAMALWAVSRGGPGGAPILATLLAFACVGFALAKVRTELARAPVLERKFNLAEVQGRVELVEPRSTRGQRVTLRVISIAGVAPDNLPKRARIRLMNVHKGLTPGDLIRVKATLAPPGGPALPGGYDFGRTAWFMGLGATGYALSAPAIEEHGAEASLRGRFSDWLERLRQSIGERIAAAVPGDAGAIATSLITGERGGISEETTDAFRDSGLLHILSISGLHMVIMAGAVFASVRILLAAVPVIALRYPTKKWAAAAALAAAWAYLLLSGSSIATVRAFVMIAIMFLAVMVDRPALAMRNVALSALVILVIAPESLLDAGFQMSFAAVVSLIAAYEMIRERAADGPERGTLFRIGFFLGGIVLSTVIASLAVAPFAAYHFHRSQQYALLANLFAIPICNLIVMPAGLLTLVLMPLGLEALPLWIMEQGIAAVMWSARLVAGLPGAVANIPAIGNTAFAFMVGGGLWLTLWRRRWRLIGLGALAAGVALSTQTPRPDVLAGLDGALVAVRTPDGQLAATSSGRATFELSRWLEYDGDSREPKDVLDKGRAFRCDGIGCVATVGGHMPLSIARHAHAFSDDCATATILVATIPAPKSCTKPALVLDYFSFRENGGFAIYFGAGQAGSTLAAASPQPAMRIETIAALRGDRPWAQEHRRQRPRPTLPAVRDAAVLENGARKEHSPSDPDQ
jgi:competence protein ComEC